MDAIRHLIDVNFAPIVASLPVGFPRSGVAFLKRQHLSRGGLQVQLEKGLV